MGGSPWGRQRSQKVSGGEAPGPASGWGRPGRSPGAGNRVPVQTVLKAGPRKSIERTARECQKVDAGGKKCEDGDGATSRAPSPPLAALS